MEPTPARRPLTLNQYRRGYLRMRSSLHDRVTDLPVLASVVDRLRTELDARARLGLVRVEVGNLAAVESLYGWQVFDQVRQQVAQRLAAEEWTELPSQRMICLDRLAGDTFFVVVLEREDGADIEAPDLPAWTDSVERRLQPLTTGEVFEGLNPPLDFRCGAATLSPDPFYRFERRVYAAVDDAGRSAERRRARRESGWGEELQRIIREARVNSVFQPVIDLASRESIGFEALVRGPRDSLFEMPGSMFRLSRRLGIGDALDALCRRVAFEQTPRLTNGDTLFLNVLPHALTDGADELIASVEASDVAAERLVVEVSEREPVERPELWCRGVSRLRERGIRFALDDVGTGPDSRHFVSRLEPDYVKIDGSLVKGVDQMPIRQEVLKTLVDLANDVGASVVAEGVETEGEASVVHESGARYGQGFLFAVPSPMSPAVGGEDPPAQT